MSELFDRLKASLKTEEVEIEGEPVLVRELLAREGHVLGFGDDKRTPEIIAACVVEPGTRLPVFAPQQAAQLPLRIAGPLMAAISRVNGWSVTEVESAEGE